MVVLAVLLYCLVPSGCPIGHIVYLWTLTVIITSFLYFAQTKMKQKEWGSRGRWFDSSHSDQNEENR